MSRVEKEINELLSYRIKCNQWKELKIYGDVSALAIKAKRSTKTISKACNNGIGSLTVLRIINTYYEARIENMPNKVKYFSNTKNSTI